MFSGSHSHMSISVTGPSVEIRTVSVEKVLEPLISQLSILIGRNDSGERPKGLSRNKDVILDLLKSVRIVCFHKSVTYNIAALTCICTNLA